MIVVAGEALIDLIPAGAGSDSGSDELSINPGGGPFNTARWLSCLGLQPVAFLGALGFDPLGLRLRSALDEAGVDLNLVVDVDLPATLALAQLDEAGVAEYSFYADGTSVRGLTAAAVSGALSGVETVTALHLGGVALALAPSSEALEHAAALAWDRGALVLLDPNVRPGLIADRADYMRRFEHVLARTDVVKLSVEDLAWLAPGVEFGAAVDGLLSCGPAVVLLTDGGEGVSVHFGGGGDDGGGDGGVSRVELLAEKVDVVDTIGAGDAFGAGFLAHLLCGAGAGSPAAAGRLNRPDGGFLDPTSVQAASAPPSGRLTRPGGGFLDPRGPGGGFPNRRGVLQDREAVLQAARFAIRIAGIACRQRGAKPPPDLPDVTTA